MEVIRRDYDDEEVIRVVDNASAPASSRVTLRMCIGYSAFVRQQAEKGMSIASAEGLKDPKQTTKSHYATSDRSRHSDRCNRGIGD